MLDDVRDHFLAFLRQKIGAPVKGAVAQVLRNIEKLAAELLEDVVAPDWVPAGPTVYDFVGAPFSPRRWDFTRISGSDGLGDLIDTIKRIDDSRGSDEGSLFEQADVERWYRAALVLRYCAEIREHGLTRPNFDLLAQGIWRMPTSSTSKQLESMGRFIGSAPRLAAPRPAVQPHSRDTNTHEGELGSVLTEQAVDMQVSSAPAELVRAEKRLTIEREARRVLIDGSVQRVTPQPLRLLVLLAERTLGSKGPVRNFTIEKELKRAPKELIHELRCALKAGRKDSAEIHAWIENHRSHGYELVLSPEQIEIRS